MADPSILKEVLRESGLTYAQTARSYVFTCPKCQGVRKLYMLKKTGRFVCWVCKETDNFQGKPEYALAALLNVSVKEMSTRLYGGQSVAVDLYLDAQLTDFFGDEDDEDFEDFNEIPAVGWPIDYYPIDDPLAEKGALYLAGRGIDLNMARHYNIHYSPVEQRVVFPVQDHGVLYGWQGRIIIPTKFIDDDGNEQEIDKILSSTGIPRERTLMFSDRLRGAEHAILCEGPVDAIKAHLCGGNVCAMGKAVSPEQMKLLVNGGVKRIYLALDPDAAEEMQRLMYDYFADVELYSMIAPQDAKTKEKVDLGAMTYEQVYDLFRGAYLLPAGHLFSHLSNGRD